MQGTEFRPLHAECKGQGSGRQARIPGNSPFQCPGEQGEAIGREGIQKMMAFSGLSQMISGRAIDARSIQMRNFRS
jgi:hypothetical protein